MTKTVKNPKILTMLRDPLYTPNRLLNAVSDMLECTSDAQLGRELEIANGQISRMRSKIDQISPNTILKIMDMTTLSLQKIRELAGMPDSYGRWNEKAN